MPSRYALTIQLQPDLPGHAAVVLTDPSGQTFAGFGPRHHSRSFDRGQFDVHSVQPGALPPRDYSNVFGDNEYRTFTVPIAEWQAEAAHREINRISSEHPWYNVWKQPDPRVCTSIVNQIMHAAGLGEHLYTVPQVSLEYLSDIADTLANDPKARVAIHTGLPIPDALRGIQRDYAYVGGGPDTPSERVRRTSSGQATGGAATLDPQEGGWSPATGGDDVRRLTRRSSGNSPEGLGSTTSPVPFASSPKNEFDERFGSWSGLPDGNQQIRQASRPLGVFTGEPMPIYPVQPPIWGLLDRTRSSPR